MSRPATTSSRSAVTTPIVYRDECDCDGHEPSISIINRHNTYRVRRRVVDERGAVRDRPPTTAPSRCLGSD